MFGRTASRARRFTLIGIAGLIFLAVLDIFLLATFKLDVLRFGTDTVGLSSTRFQGSFESDATYGFMATHPDRLIESRWRHSYRVVLNRR